MPPEARRTLGPGLEMSRVLNGMWQVSGGHGHIDRERAVRSMVDYHDAGLTTWDLADHYGPAEDLIGEFRRRMRAEKGQDALEDAQAFTKWVPRPGPMPRSVVQSAIDRSLSRMDVQKLDLLQFHWWEYRDERYLDALEELAAIRDEGKILHLALTNFDTDRLVKIAGRGIPIASNQVQYSLIDLRPEVEMAAVCEAGGVQLLTYGTLCGGLLSEAYLGRSEPSPIELNTVSLRKYKQMIDAWGGWSLFQELLAAVDAVARTHDVSIANVAVRYILDRPAVGGVIIGARLGVSEHIEDTLQVFRLNLTSDDRSRIKEVLGRSRDLFAVIGDCGDEYR